MPAPQEEAGSDEAKGGRGGHDQGRTARPTPRVNIPLFRYYAHTRAVPIRAGNGEPATLSLKAFAPDHPIPLALMSASEAGFATAIRP